MYFPEVIGDKAVLGGPDIPRVPVKRWYLGRDFIDGRH
jgi:hypothetical protein